MRSSRLPPVTLPPPDVAGVITLDQVRKEPRKQNEYVDTLRSSISSGVGKNVITKNVMVSTTRDRVPMQRSSIIRTQPVSTSPPLKKDLQIVEADDRNDDSIICSKCGKCRCDACTGDRELPSRWLCGDKVKISPHSLVEAATCLCCVKACFYHCTTDEDEEYKCEEEPCAGCSRPHCCKRWTCILAMSMCLPCLCFYLPAKCGLNACTACYNKCRKKGCACQSNSKAKKVRSSAQDSSQYRGLLVESDRESSSVSNS